MDDTIEKKSERSARLRYTVEIAKLAGFEFDPTPKNLYGGFFKVSQLERILAKLRELEMLRQEIKDLKTVARG